MVPRRGRGRERAIAGPLHRAQPTETIARRHGRDRRSQGGESGRGSGLVPMVHGIVIHHHGGRVLLLLLML